MTKQFNYTRPPIVVFGYIVSGIIFIAPIALIFPNFEKLTIELVFYSSIFLLLYFLLETFVWKKFSVNLGEHSIKISKMTGTTIIPYDKIESVAFVNTGVGNDLVIRYINQARKNKASVIPSMRIGKQDLNKIEKVLSEKQHIIND